MKSQNLSIRWLYLVVGVLAMLFAGIIYAWSILKAPLASEFSWGASELALNFTLAMSFFCIGGLLGAVAAYVGGVVDGFIMRITDVFMAIPEQLLAMCVVAALGATPVSVIAALSMPSSFTRATYSFILLEPSKREYSVWT